jgi:hypothetical protein
MTVANGDRLKDRRLGQPSISDVTVVKPSFLEGRRSGDRRSLVSRVEFLQPHLFGVLRLNPAAQIIRQRGVYPITTRA